MQFITFLSVLILLFSTQFVSAEGTPRVGRKAAAKYFSKEAEPEQQMASEESRSISAGDGLLMLHVGGYTESTSYQWKDSAKRTGVGSATYGLTYLFSEWNGLDVNLRFDFNEYKLDEERATKLSFMPLWTFPRAQAKFPLYFGFGAGAGVFFTQVEDESNLSLDYQLVAGARFADVIENFGLFVEFGMKNHLHLLSDGQFNGTALSGGAVFTF